MKYLFRVLYTHIYTLYININIQHSIIKVSNSEISPLIFNSINQIHTDGMKRRKKNRYVCAKNFPITFNIIL